jgi:hypothetical protein
LSWTRKIKITSIYSFAKHSGVADEDWYHGYLTASTQVAQGGPPKDSIHIPEDHDIVLKEQIAISIETYIN